MMKRLAFLITLVFILTLTACGTATAAGKTAADFFDACITLDQSEINRLCPEFIFFSDTSDAKLAIFSRTVYEIGDTFVANGGATVDVKLTTLDLPAILDEALASDDPAGIFTAKIAADDAPMKTETVRIKLTQADDAWLFDDAAELTDALYGGLVAHIRTLDANTIERAYDALLAYLPYYNQTEVNFD